MESFRDENVGARDDPQLEALLDLVSSFGRVKLSLNSLMVRPVWREKMRQELQAAGLGHDDHSTDDQSGHWLSIFFRLSRKLHICSGGMSMRLVAEAMGVPVSSATRFVDGMVQRGLFERHPDAHDRRLVLVKLTETGNRVFTVMDSSLRDAIWKMMQQFTPQERQQLLELGTRMFELWSGSLELVPAGAEAKDPAPKNAASAVSSKDSPARSRTSQPVQPSQSKETP